MDLDNRMKKYEAATRFQLPIRMPVIIRLDGKAFHTLTKNCERPYDAELRLFLVTATSRLLHEVPARMAYCQSDEISLLLIDYNKFESQQWFDGVIQKMASVSASIMGVEFNTLWLNPNGRAAGFPGYFDSRVFPIPERDVENYFVSRQQDCIRNAISMAAQAEFSSKELHGKHSDEMRAMLLNKGVQFDNHPEWFRFGSVVTRDEIISAPVFTHDRYLKKFLTIEEE